jgi:hypothetical protein
MQDAKCKMRDHDDENIHRRVHTLMQFPNPNLTQMKSNKYNVDDVAIIDKAGSHSTTEQSRERVIRRGRGRQGYHDRGDEDTAVMRLGRG